MRKSLTTPQSPEVEAEVAPVVGEAAGAGVDGKVKVRVNPEAR